MERSVQTVGSKTGEKMRIGRGSRGTDDRSDPGRGAASDQDHEWIGRHSGSIVEEKWWVEARKDR
jgi:hypothetical protein